MIGNDIIDLSLAKTESNWKRRGFLYKIFTPKEQLLILETQNPEMMVWNLWSRKESAYKIYNRQTGIRAFIPLKLECFDAHTEIGKVICDEHIYFTKTEITDQYIHTFSVTNISDFDKISVLHNATPIKKLNGLPFISSNSQIVSVSHHGQFQRLVTLL